jgi:POT family proton-dependent oligopeptide transporter
MTWFWMKRNAKKAQQISIPAKFALGILLMGLGYLVLVLPIDVFPTANGVINSWWIVFSYFLQTAGELFVGPIGFAMVGELVPARLEGLMMGIWQLATGVAGALSAYMADMTTTPKLDTTAASATDPAYAHAFLLFGAATVGVAIITALLTPYIKRIISSSDKRVVAGH